ncbi:MAG: OB-fold nucleic acid binding domain-containing protein [Archaeoglobaceae archaeon]|nr:OB-fold nucleic acid binding domain-containing protein [Archaeoglobaceae archaeon]MDW8117633.1 OB-fold nucleic acid binding domain-containing protein [Archaeoglobaceae archaeon]
MDRREEILDRFGDLLDEETIELLVKHEKVNFEKISEIDQGRVNIRGKVSGLGDPERASEIYISDETGRIRVIVSREIYYKADIGKDVEIYNGFAREGKRGLEIHVNRFSIVRFLE